jgi:excinuclease ABC subunit A
MVVAEGTPEAVAADPTSYTGQFLAPLLEGRAAQQPVRRTAAKKAPAKKAPAKKAAAKKATTTKAPAAKKATKKAAAR